MQSLSAYDIYVKLSIDGKTTDAFSARTLPEPAIKKGHRDGIIELSRIRYSIEKETVQERIALWISDPTKAHLEVMKIK